MNLVPEAKVWWKLHSMQALLILSIVGEWWLNSTMLQSVLPPRLVAIVTPVVVVLVALLRLRKQILTVPPPKPTVPRNRS